MKITFVLEKADLAGGVRVVALYADALRRRGHEVVVVSTPAPTIPLKTSVKHLLRGYGWPRIDRGTRSHMDDVDVEHRILKRYRPVTDTDVDDADVVIATWWETAQWVADLSPSKGAKAYFVQHDERAIYNSDDTQNRNGVIHTWSLPMTKITIAHWLVDLLTPFSENAPVYLVPNSVDCDRFSAPPRDRSGRPTVGVMYYKGHYKGCDISLEAFNIARDQLPHLRLLCFGSHEPTEDMPLPDGAEFHLRPDQADIPGIYARCDAWLFGSRTEGFGLPILEAMACRTPVIGTPAGAAPELVGQGGGFLVKPEDPVAMAEAILRLYDMPANAWRDMSNTARHIAEQYTWDDATTKFESALEEIVDRNRASKPVRVGA